MTYVPQLTQFPKYAGNIDDYMEALRLQEKWETFAVGQAYGMLKVTPQFDTKPEWLDAASEVRMIQSSQKLEGSDLHVALCNLVGQATHDGMQIKRIAHGPIGDSWCIFAEVSK